MENDLIYWIWLQGCLGVNSRKLKPALELYGDAKKMYEAKEYDLRLAGFFSETELRKLCSKATDHCERAVRNCENSGITAYHLNGADYPKRLAAISSPPIVIYVKGKLPPEKKLHAGIVGTRYPSDGSKSLAYNFAYDLAKNNSVIVSGGANGIDMCAHKGTVDAGGVTICVVAGGIDRISSRELDFIMNGITVNGAVVTEYPPGVKPEVYNFPMRNRIITGLSDCNIVVQAGIGSGALIAAKCSIAQYRKLFAVPGPSDNERFSGSNTLLKFGCSAALTYRDILHWRQSELLKPTPPEKQNPQINEEMKLEITGKFENIPRSWEDGKRAFRPPTGYILNSEIDKACRSFDMNLFYGADDDYEEELDSEPDIEAYNRAYAAAAEKAQKKGNKKISTAKTEITMKSEEKTAEEPAPKTEENRQVHFLLDPDDPESRMGIMQEAMALRKQPQYEKMSLPARIGEVIQKRFGFVLDEIEEPVERKYMYTQEYTDVLRLRRIYRLLGWEYEQELQIEMTDIFPETFDGVADYAGKSMKKNRRRVSEPVIEPQTASDQKKDSGAAGSGFGENDIYPAQKTDKKSENAVKEKKILLEQLTENASSVYDTISDTPINVNTIKLRTGLSIGAVLAALTELQIKGLAEVLPGSRYVRL